MASRLKLDKRLKEIIGNGNVYYQPPESIKMSYPCFIYKLDGIESERADNIKYIQYERYKVTYVDRDPDAIIPDIMDELPMCSMVTPPYVSDGLNHWVYEIYLLKTKDNNS